MKIKKIVTIFFISIVSCLFVFQRVYALDIFPPEIRALLEDPFRTAENRIRVFFMLMLGAFLILVIFMIIKGLMEFSRDETKDIQEAAKIIQKQFVSVGGVFVAILGLGLILVFFRVPGLFTINQACITYADSYGCWVCSKGMEYSYIVDGVTKTGKEVCELCNIHSDAEISNSIQCKRTVGATSDTGAGNPMSDQQIKDTLEAK